MSRRAIDIRILGKKRTGDETVFFELTREVLRQDKASEYLLLTNESDTGELAELGERLGLAQAPNARIITLPASNRFVWNLLTLPLFLARKKVDVFHTQYILPFWVPRRTRVANHIHDVSFAAYPELIGAKDRLFLETLIPRSLKRSDRIIVPSQFTKDEIIRYYGVLASKIAVVPNAIGSAFFEAITDQQSDEEIRQSYQLPERFILSVGTLQPRKNIPFLIEAFSRVRERLPGMKLVLVGNRAGHHFDFRIDHLIHTLGLENEIIFPGYIADGDLPRVMRLATLFVFPSLYEGFGIPMLEAMSQGVPVAASATPALREVGGEAALYFDPAAIASLEEALYNLCINSSLQAELQAKGEARLGLFSWEKSAHILLEVYQELSSE